MTIGKKDYTYIS